MTRPKFNPHKPPKCLNDIAIQAIYDSLDFRSYQQYTDSIKYIKQSISERERLRKENLKYMNVSIDYLERHISQSVVHQNQNYIDCKKQKIMEYQSFIDLYSEDLANLNFALRHSLLYAERWKDFNDNFTESDLSKLAKQTPLGDWKQGTLF